MASSRLVLLVSVAAAVVAAGCGRNRPAGGAADAAADRPAAQRCATDLDCPSGTCRDGVCCAGTCEGVCTSCAGFFTGREDGVCAPVKTGLDPHDECTHDSASDRCGNDGKCDGTGACRKATRGVVCASPGCSDAHTFVAAGVCDGAGRCQAGPRSACGEHPCTATGCAQPCTVAAECPAGTRCLNGSCRMGKSAGEPCAAAGECSSGFCAPEPDGVCCDQPCLDGCLACLRKSTGLADGTCGPVLRGLDPREHCPVDPAASCGRDGTCDGAGSCRIHAVDTPCGPGACAGSSFTPPPTCDGAGSCSRQRAPVDCARNACTTEGCTVTCHGDADCGATSYCVLERGTCAARQDPGAACTGGRECASGSCVDGVCCETTCASRCYACRDLKTGGPSGLCLPVRAGTDPDADCDLTEQTTCGSDGTCDGAGQCRLWADQTICAAGRCDSGGHHLSARTCHQGSCGQPAIEDCGLASCEDATGCKRVCAGDQDCVGSTYCDGSNHTCATQRVLGASCVGNTQCLSGYCTDGVCCNTRCGGPCHSCRAPENGQTVDGICGEVADGTDPGDDCQVGSDPCGLDGSCVAGRCRLAGPATVCNTPSCQNAPGDVAATFRTASYCDGNGGCSPVTSSACAGNVLCLSGEQCRSPVCATDQDCVTGARCDNGACVAM